MKQKDVDVAQKYANVKQKGLALAAKVSRSSAVHDARIKCKEQQHAKLGDINIQAAWRQKMQTWNKQMQT